MSPRHVPVMLAEVLAALAPAAGDIFVDATFGAGGYSEALLEVAGTTVIGIDRDPAAIAGGGRLVDRSGGRLRLVERRFSELADVLHDLRIAAVQGIVLDVGVSSMQLDEAGRGFSFMSDGPLDMRMGGDGPSAADIVNTVPESELAEILWKLGEEKRSRAIARAIVDRRKSQPFARTGDLARLVERVIGRGAETGKHPATRTFQALRIHVNDELGELAAALVAAEAMLAPGGRLAVVTFHSLEDRIVKEFLRERTGATPQASRHLPAAKAAPAPSFQFVNQRALSPSEEEIRMNPRARSARLRAARRTPAPAWGQAADALVPRIGERRSSARGRKHGGR